MCEYKYMCECVCEYVCVLGWPQGAHKGAEHSMSYKLKSQKGTRTHECRGPVPED